MKYKLITNLLLALVAGFLSTGCTATLQHGTIYTQPTADKGPIGVTTHAENIHNHIGWGTLTVFAIPVVPVSLNGNGDTDLMLQIKDAVEQAGFKAKLVENATAADGAPVLTCRVEKFGFRNYTWLFPFVFNWGTIQLNVAIADSGGKTLWKKTYTGKANGFYDFDTPVNNALTTILNDLSSDLANLQLKSP